VPYEELERHARTLTRASYEGTLVDYAEVAFGRLGVEVFDPQAFVEGVSAVLESGDFVFVYAGRDLDERTRRIMTYLSEGARMTFFAVEVDHYRPSDSDSAVMVPRTAFVPSWIAGGGSPARREAAKSRTQRLADADDATRELIAKMDALAAAGGLVTTRATSGYRYSAPGGVGYIGVYASSRGMEVNMADIQDDAHAALVDDVLDAMSQAAGRGVTARAWPAISCEAVVTNWPTIESRVIKPLMALRRQDASESAPSE
jgi:hypothetical protein